MTVVEFAEAIIALDRERFEARAEARSLLSRLRQAEADARGFVAELDEARRERDALAVLDAGRQMLPDAIETLRWIAHGHTDEIQTVRDVARRRLAALGVAL